MSAGKLKQILHLVVFNVSKIRVGSLFNLQGMKVMIQVFPRKMLPVAMF